VPSNQSVRVSKFQVIEVSMFQSFLEISRCSGCDNSGLLVFRV
jgi:hypothetical protein